MKKTLFFIVLIILSILLTACSNDFESSDSKNKILPKSNFNQKQNQSSDEGCCEDQEYLRDDIEKNFSSWQIDANQEQLEEEGGWSYQEKLEREAEEAYQEHLEREAEEAYQEHLEREAEEGYKKYLEDLRYKQEELDRMEKEREKEDRRRYEQQELNRMKWEREQEDRARMEWEREQEDRARMEWEREQEDKWGYWY